MHRYGRRCVGTGARKLGGSLVLLLGVLACSPAPKQNNPAIGGLSPAGTAGDDYFQYFRDRLVAESDGAISPRLLTRGEIGSDDQIFSSLRRGRIQLAVNGTYSISTLVPEFSVLGMPFLFQSEEEIDFVVKRVVEPFVGPALEANGIKLLKFMPMGWINFYGTQKIADPDELRGLRVRQPNEQINQLFALKLGADVVALPSNEVVTALQTGLIDAGSTVTLNYLWSGISVHAPHLILTQHAFLFNAFIADRSWWDGLGLSSQEAVLRALPSDDFFISRMRSAECADIVKAIGEGVSVHRMTPKQRSQWQSVAVQAHDEMLDRIGGRARALYAAVQEGRDLFYETDGQMRLHENGSERPPAGVARCEF